MLYDTKDFHIYCANLLTLSNDAEIAEHKSIQKNIENAVDSNLIETKNLLLLKKTIYRNLYREIITDKLIPAYRLISVFSLPSIKKAPNSPAFIKVPETIDKYGRTIWLSHVSRYERYKLNAYYSNHSDKEEYAQELDNIFNQSKQDYQRKLAKN